MTKFRKPKELQRIETDSTEQNTQKESIPWKWLGYGVLATLIGTVLAFFWVKNSLTGPIEVLGTQPTAAIIYLTAPPSAVPTETAIVKTPTPVPTFTPIPTPDTAVAPDNLTIGFYALVSNTDGLGVTVRGGPNRSNVRLIVAEEDALVLVTDGPVEDFDFTWWQILLEDGTEGWAVEIFLLPAAGP